MGQIQAWGENHRCHYPINCSDPSGLEPPASVMDRRMGNTWPDRYRAAAEEAYREYRRQPGHQGIEENSVEMFFLGPALGKGVGLTVRLAEQGASSVTLGAGLPGSDKIMASAIRNSATLTEDGFYNFFMHGAKNGSLWIKTSGRSIPVTPAQLAKVLTRGLEEAGLPLDTPIQLNACFGSRAVGALENLGLRVRSWTGKIDVHSNGHITPHHGSTLTP